MTYGGFEIDMPSLEKADCLLVTNWYGGRPTRVLIDGGNRGSVDTVRDSLQQDDLNVDYIDHLICSHPHDDHAGGLVELVKDRSISFGMAWMHLPEQHVDLASVNLALSRSAGSKRVEVIEKSLETANELLSALRARSIPVQEPFRGDQIGFLTVCGPSKDYYEELVSQFADESKIWRLELAESIIAKSAKSDALSDAPITSPENNSSTILGTVRDGGTYLFTADAGADALNRAASSYELRDLRWMQLPHHGSRHNITPSLISHFRPETAFASAPGTTDHPRRAVVNAFKREGTAVYSTHYPSGGAPIWHHRGNVPPRSAYTVTATPLWDAD